MEGKVEIPASRPRSSSKISVVDIECLVKGRHEPAHSTINALTRACTSIGFLQVTGHGITHDVCSKLLSEAALFFALPVKEKMKVAIENSPMFRGYVPVKSKGKTDYGDNLHEGFVIFQERPIGGSCPMHGPNQWPGGKLEFKEAMLSYFVAAEKLARALLRGFAMTLGYKPDIFNPMFDDPMMMLKLNYYPPQSTSKHGNEIGVVAHCDSSAFTIVWQDDVGGLEALTRDGEWVPVPPISRACVVNIGNLMQIWSNGRFPSTPHRVVNRSGRDRYSIAFFVNPNYTTVMKPLIGESSGDFKPFRSGQYQQGVYRRIFPQRSKSDKRNYTSL
jgi:isopenicillin N synthase-like dioxygenase